MGGVFIAFEGGEGSGKSTQTRILQAWLEEKGLPVLLTREPGGTELGWHLRKILLDLSSTEVALKTEALLFAADRAEHLARVIAPALSRGEVVISDRYVDSLIAYEIGGRQLQNEEVRRVATWATDGLLPDLTVLLDVSPSIGLSRRGELDRMESQPLEFHERVRATYLELAGADPDRYLVIDAEQNSEAISVTIQRRCEVLLSL
ncbi:MAG TPA: dTMP kinase [Candidatus Nanopelagicaceae bacterium]|jgi:dTMP kinase